MNSKNSNSENNYPVTFFGKMLTFSRIKIATDDFELITAHLEEVSPNKDSLIPIVIDSEIDLDLKKLIDLLWEWGLQPIGVTKGILDLQAIELRVAIFPADGKRMQRIAPQARAKILNTPEPHEQLNATTTQASESAVDEELIVDDTIDSLDTALDNDANYSKEVSEKQQLKLNKQKTSSKGTPTTSRLLDRLTRATRPDIQYAEVPLAIDRITSLVYDQMLRSGQSINHVGGDLVLTNSVNDGAEAITDNSLHIYGKGMGRLVAGATGDHDAHIFCQRFNPSLVSVAGTYMLRDNIPKEVVNKAVQVSYKEGEGLVFRVMDDWTQTITQNTISR